MPQIDGEWWTIAGNPDLGHMNSDKQEPVDFAIWPAADGTWQLWSCIRYTNIGGRTRVLYGWQGDNPKQPNWKPMGIAMEADPKFGETPGGLQAPYVMKLGAEFLMFYGEWENIAIANGVDGKKFTRQIYANNKVGMFNEGPGDDANTRDAMVLRVGDHYICYYAAHPGKSKHGSVYARTSTDLRNWSPSKIVAFGGAAGTGGSSAECPFVLYQEESGYYYLFRTQHYGKNAHTTVYRSKDPLNFGVNDDRFLVGTLPIAAPEIFEYQGEQYIAALLPTLDGIQVARLKWVPKK